MLQQGMRIVYRVLRWRKPIPAIVLGLVVALSVGASSAPLTVPSRADAASIPIVSQYGVFEQTLSYPTTSLRNPWEQVSVSATFTSPSGKHVTIDGFYYDTDTYKFRFTPAEIGTYSYSGSISGPSGEQSFRGTFSSVAGSNHGFIQRVPGSSYQLQFADGSFLAGTGFNDCWSGTTAANGQSGRIGDPAIEPAGESGPVPLDTYFAKYGDGEGQFNLFRWNPGNCSYKIYQVVSTTGNTYLVPEGMKGDVLLATAKRHGFHIQFTFFYGNPPPYYPRAADGTPEAAAIKRALRYAVARYGAYVDIWEMTNETDANTVSDAWLTFTTKYVRSIDPYHRLITNSNDRPSDSQYLDLHSPHLYGNRADLYSITDKSNGIPDVAGEVGIGRDPQASNPAFKHDFMRVQMWTAVMARLGIIFWNTSYSYRNDQNMYLGSRERTYNRVLQSLVSGLCANADSVKLSASGAAAYGLTCPQMLLVYVTRYAGQTLPTQTSVAIDVPFANGTAEWVDPATGAVLQTFAVTGRGHHTFQTPAYYDDIVLRIVDPP